MRVCAMAACAVVAAGMVLTGCGPAAPATSGTPTVVGTGPTAAATPLCTPESGGSATPCTQEQYEEMKKLDALYAEAEDVYRRFVAEDVKLLRSGGLAEGPVLDLIGGPMVDRYKARRQDQHDLGITMTGEVTVGFVRRLPGRAHEGSEVALFSCLDGSALVGSSAGESVGHGDIVAYNTYFKHVGEALKIWWDEGKKVTSC